MADSNAWKPKVIIFDLLTALLNSWELWDASTPSGTREEGRPWRVAYIKKTFSTPQYVPYETMVKEAAREVGLPDSAPTKLLDGWSGIQTWPEVGSVLRNLKEKGYKLGVVTNSSKELGTIAAMNVAKSVYGDDCKSVFDAVVTAEESGHYKPRPEAYKAILDAMGVEAKDVLFVAGSAGDVKGAAEAGMKVVWHNRVGLDGEGNWSPLEHEEPRAEASVAGGSDKDGNWWSPLKDGQRGNGAKNGVTTNGNWSPLGDDQPVGGENGSDKDGNWSPLDDSNGVKASKGGDWSPLREAASLDGALADFL